MKQIIAALVLSSIAVPALAQDPAPDRPRNFLEDGAQGLLRDFFSEIEPRMRDFAQEIEPRLRDLAEGLAPLAEDLSALMDDLQMYEAPVRLPNGDILIRRKPEPPPADTPRAPESGPIDL